MTLEETLKADLVAFIDGDLNSKQIAERLDRYEETLDDLHNNDALEKPVRTMYRLMRLAASDQSLAKDKAFINKVK